MGPCGPVWTRPVLLLRGGARPGPLRRGETKRKNTFVLHACLRQDLCFSSNPPIRRVSTKGAKLQQTLQSFSRVSTQSFSRDSVQSSSFSRDSALGVRRGGSAGVGGRGGRGARWVTFGYVGLRWVTLGYLRLPLGPPFFGLHFWT